MNAIRRNHWSTSILLMVLALFPMSAYAGLLTDVTTLLSTYIQPGDESIAMLCQVFGDFTLNPFGTATTTSGCGGTGNILGSMFQQYNIFFFTVAMFWFTYTAIASLTQTMHEGVVFGQRMSTVWMPIRIAFGAVSLMPIFGGWAFCQALMMIAISLGVAGANSIASVAVASAGQFQTLVNPMGSVKQAASLNNIELNMIKMVACQEAAGMLETEAAQNNVQMSGQTGTSVISYFWKTNDKIDMNFPSKAGQAACGSISLQFSSRSNTGLSSSFGFRIDGINYVAIRDLSMAAHQNALKLLEVEARKIVKGSTALANPGDLNAAVAGVQGGYFGSYGRIFQASVKQLQSDADAVSNKTAIDQKLLDRMKSGGWATLGIWYGVFAEANEAMNEMLDPVVTFKNPTVATSKGDELVNSVTGLIVKAEAQQQLQPSVGLTTATGDTSVGQMLLGGTIQMLAGSSSTGASQIINPILAFKNIGDNSIVFVETIFALYHSASLAKEIALKALPAGRAATAIGNLGETALEPASSNSGAKRGVSGALSNLVSGATEKGMSVIIAIGLPLFAIGCLMAFYIPLIPFVQWFSGLIHWFVTVIESFLGASLWALAHFDSDGEGMGQRASYGYQYMLNNFARPIIMTLGFFMASAAVTILGTFLFKYFGTSIASAQGNTTTGLLSIVAYIVILGVMGIALVNNSFSIMQGIADSIIGFIGSAGRSSFEGGQESRINALFVNAVSKGGGALSGGLKKPSEGKGGGLGLKSPKPPKTLGTSEPD